MGTPLTQLPRPPQVYSGLGASALLDAVRGQLTSMCRRASNVFCVSPGTEQRSDLPLTPSRANLHICCCNLLYMSTVVSGADKLTVAYAARTVTSDVCVQQAARGNEQPESAHRRRVHSTERSKTRVHLLVRAAAV